MNLKLNKKNIIFYIIPILSLIGGLWQNQYIYDGYHWGFILTNAIELINGKIPYKEIFLEYGIVSVIANSITLIIFDKNVYSIIALTCLLYSITLLVISQLTYKITKSRFYSILAVVIIFVLYPWPTTPWPNFYSFFFTVMFCNFFIKKKKKYHIFSGISLALAYLSLTTVYNLIIGLFFLSVIVTYFLLRKIINKKEIEKIYYTLFSFIIFIGIFAIYLYLNDLISIWASYQTLPFIFNGIF